MVASAGCAVPKSDDSDGTSGASVSLPPCPREDPEDHEIFVYGRVTENATGLPISNARIAMPANAAAWYRPTIEQSESGCYTVLAKYIHSADRRASFSLKVEATNFHDATVGISETLPPGSITELNIGLDGL